jgi:hypothetical protein
VLEQGKSLHLVRKAPEHGGRHKLGADYFECHPSLGEVLLGLVDDAHAAPPHFSQDCELADGRWRGLAIGSRNAIVEQPGDLDGRVIQDAVAALEVGQQDFNARTGLWIALSCFFDQARALAGGRLGDLLKEPAYA